MYFMFVKLFLSFHMMCPGIFVVKMVGQITTNQDAVGKAHKHKSYQSISFFSYSNFDCRKKVILKLVCAFRNKSS